MGEHRKMTALVRSINLPGIPMEPTREYRYIPAEPAACRAARTKKQMAESRKKGVEAQKKIGPEEIEKGIRLRQIGLTWKETGKELGVTGNAIRIAIVRYEAKNAEHHRER